MGQVPLESIVGVLAQRARLHPTRAALICGGRHISYAEIWTKTCAAAAVLHRLGVVKGDRILLAAPSVPAFAFGYFATHLLGAIAIPLDPHAPQGRRQDLIERTSPKIVFGAEADCKYAGADMRSIETLDESIPAQMDFTPPSADSLADILFTTGTTGQSKGVRLTHSNLIAAARHINAVIGNGADDVEVLPLPLYHSFGLGRMRCNLLAGGTITLVDGFRLPGEVFRAVKEHRATGLVGVPAAFSLLLRFGARGLGAFAGQLRYLEIGSAPMPLADKRALMELLPQTRLCMHYGLTEASRSAFIEFHRHRDRLESAGLPAPGVTLSVRDDAGYAVASGEAGMLWIGGPHVSRAYWDNPELSAATFIDGYVCTGDVAHLDRDGFVHLHGRRDDMINVGGFNVSPDEVERALEQHPAVAEAACIGIPDPRNAATQTVRAYLVLRDHASRASDEQLTAWARNQLEAYKVPFEFTWVTVLPRTASGKLQRAALRKLASGEH